MIGRRDSNGKSPRPQSDETGFTLLELLVVMMILPLITGGIAAALVSVLQMQGHTLTRFSNSSDSQITSEFYVRDVQSAAYVTTDASITSPYTATSPQLCGSSLGGTFVVGLYWGQSEATYWAIGTTLIRRYCAVNGSYQTPSVTSSRNVSFNISSGQGSAVVTGSAASTASDGWASTVGVSGIAVGVSEPETGTSSYTYSLQGTPRAWNSQAGGFPGGGSPPPPPLLLLGTGTSTLTCGGNGSIDVNGGVALNSTSNGAASLSGHATATATSFYTADQTDPSGALAETGNATFSPPGTPSAGPSFADPYQNLTPPNPTGMATYSGGTYQGPGIYTSTLSVSGNTHQVFASGIYILEQGISLSGNASISSTSSGVFFYVTGGQVSIAGNGGASLQPLASPPSPIADLVIWQVAADTNPVYLTGNGSGSFLGGTIYAPGAQVGGSGNAGLSATAIIAASLSCDGNSSTTIG